MTKKQQPTLAERVLEASLSVDRSALAGALGRLVAKRQRRTVAAIEAFSKADISDLVARAKADAAAVRDATERELTSPATRRRTRRTSRSAESFKKVTSRLSSPWGSSLRRPGTKRWDKLRFVLETLQRNTDAGRTTYVSDLLGQAYSEKGDRLDLHDLNGMAERRDITMGDE